MQPRKKRWRKLIVAIILVIITMLYFNKIYQNFKITESNDGIYKLINNAQKLQKNSNNEGTIYYIASNGTSDEGTDINNPMSLETANKKTYYGNDQVLFKRGEKFYGTIRFKVDASEDELFYIGNYGNENDEMPTISTAIYVDDEKAWDEVDDSIYRLDLSNREYIKGYYTTSNQLYNIGFFRDEENNIYGNKKSNLESLNNAYDFYCEDNYIYVKAEENPTSTLGKITFATRINIVYVYSNTVLDGLNIKDTGAHGVSKGEENISNVVISNCVINNIGGSYQSGITRYGNGIEFWNKAKNTLVQGCLFKNIYDAAYTLQGSGVTDGFYNNVCENNIFINCTYPIEVFCHNEYDTSKCKFEGNTIENNIIVNQGKGFGYTSRPDQYQPANLITWIIPENSGQKNTFKENKCYNCRALYYKDSGTEKDTLKESFYADYNTYYLNSDTIFFIDTETHKDISILEEYGFDQNSTFNYLSDSEIEEISNPDILNSNNYEEIKSYYDNFDIKYRNSHWKEAVLTELETIINQEDYAEILQNEEIKVSYEELKNTLDNLTKNVDTITADNVSYSYECLYKFIGKIVDEYYNNNTLNIAENELIALIEKLDNLSDQYKEIYSYYITEDNVEIETVKNKLNDTIDKYNNNLDLDITNLENIITTSKNIYNNYITTDNTYENLLNKNRIIYMTNIVDNIIDKKINKFVEEEKAKIQVEFNHDINEPTNENITATLITGNNTTIINNEGSNTYTFYENGTFNFELEIKGVKFTVAITIANINKEYKIENGYISNISKNTLAQTLENELNISNYKITHNGEKLDLNKDIISTGDILTYDNKEYTLIVSGDINKDGNCGIHDLVSFRKYLLEYSTYDNLEKMAADTNQDNSLDIKDLVGIRKIILN